MSQAFIGNTDWDSTETTNQGWELHLLTDAINFLWSYLNSAPKGLGSSAKWHQGQVRDGQYSEGKVLAVLISRREHIEQLERKGKSGASALAWSCALDCFSSQHNFPPASVDLCIHSCLVHSQNFYKMAHSVTTRLMDIVFPFRYYKLFSLHSHR